MSGAITWDVLASIFMICGAVVAVVVWVHGRLEALRRSIEAHRLFAAETYVTKAGMSEGLERIETALQRIEQRIDGLYQGPQVRSSTSRTPGR